MHTAIFLNATKIHYYPMIPLPWSSIKQGLIVPGPYPNVCREIGQLFLNIPLYMTSLRRQALLGGKVTALACHPTK
jgi:hypothetical protein